MKRCLCALLGLTLILCVAACGGNTAGGPEFAISSASQSGNAAQGESEGTASQQSASADTSGRFGFDYNGVFLYINQKMTDSLLSSIGTPADTVTAQSCHYDGEDKIYYFDGLAIYTYLDGDDSVIYDIELTGPALSTVEGLSVGDSVEAARSIYGTEESETDTCIIFSEGNDTTLQVTFDESNTITMIEYLSVE